MRGVGAFNDHIGCISSGTSTTEGLFLLMGISAIIKGGCRMGWVVVDQAMDTRMVHVHAGSTRRVRPGIRVKSE